MIKTLLIGDNKVLLITLFITLSQIYSLFHIYFRFNNYTLYEIYNVSEMKLVLDSHAC